MISAGDRGAKKKFAASRQVQPIDTAPRWISKQVESESDWSASLALASLHRTVANEFTVSIGLLTNGNNV